ncbi:phage holin family protein [Patescibacteria group bacterium]|nr:phage holin family protein [Patescibacteria group bacterium]
MWGMKFLSRIIFFFLVNLIGLIVASYFIEGFSVVPNFENLLILTCIFTVINILIKPILKFVFSPFIILTMGLFSLVINATMLKLLDIWSISITISGIQALIYATLIITIINLSLTFVAKSSFK